MIFTICAPLKSFPLAVLVMLAKRSYKVTPSMDRGSFLLLSKKISALLSFDYANEAVGCVLMCDVH